MLDCSAAVWLYPEGSYTHQTHTLTHTKALFLASSHGGMRAVHMSKPAASNIGDKAMHAVRINATSRAYNIKYESLEIYLVFGVWYSVSDVNVQAFDILYWEWEVTVALANGYCLFRLCVFKWEMLQYYVYEEQSHTSIPWGANNLDRKQFDRQYMIKAMMFIQFPALFYGSNKWT